MRIEGRCIHVAGSASDTTATPMLDYAHTLIEALATALARRGARFQVNVGKEPSARPEDPMAPALIFDWTVLATLRRLVDESGTRLKGPNGRLITCLATGKTEAQIPDNRREIWQSLLRADAVQLDFIESGWASGAVRRMRQSRLGDVFIALGGGEGVEHLAQLYARAVKPVIPLDVEIGSSSGDGSGGAYRLAPRALATPEHFVHLKDSAAGGVLLADLSTRKGTRPVNEVVEAVIRLIEALADPTAFYVRLLNPKHDAYSPVERFFRHVVDPVVVEFGYNPFEMGHGPATTAWMNQGIFEQLHHSQLVIVDLTAVRPNCFMELGYALGRQIPVLITAVEGTDVPFDAEMLEHYAWADGTQDEERKARFREYWLRNIIRPPLVQPREVL